MNKFYLLPLSLILFNPIFSDEAEVHVLTECDVAINPQLLKEFEENLALLMQKKNRKSTEEQETETTPELQEENNLETSVIKDQTSTEKETILPLSNDDKETVRKERNFTKRSTASANKKNAQKLNKEKKDSNLPPNKILPKEEPPNLSQSKSFNSLIQSEKPPQIAKETPPNDSQSLTKAEKTPSFPIEESENPLNKKKKSETPKQLTQRDPYERSGKFFFPYAEAGKEKKLDPSSLPQHLNSKEIASIYDRYISHQNHPALSEISPQTENSTELDDETQSANGETLDSERSVVPSCPSPFHEMHIGLRHSEARGVGYQSGYTTLEGFGIYDRNRSFMPFIDLRGHVFDNGKLAGNIGVGGRTLLSSIEHLLGYYFYYDIRQDRHHLTAQQVSPGIELLGERMEYRMNGYFPVGDRKSHKYRFKFDEFDGNHIFIKGKQRYAMIGADAEVGAHITQSRKYDLYAGVGPYYFSSPHASSWGGKARLLGRYKEYVSLEATYSYDHLFKSVIQGSVAINLPFGRKLKQKGKECPKENDLVLSRAAFAPYRFEIPVIKKVSRKEKAINPATGDPWKVWFVNNTSSSSGTFESPFPTLLDAQNASGPNDMIYVFPGNGTTMGMDMGFILQNGQKFFGSGISHHIHTTKGKIKIPPFSNSYPVITNTVDVVTLANGNEISGLHIVANQIAASGIIGTPNGIFGSSGIAGTTIANNIISCTAFATSGITINGHDIKIINNQIISTSVGVDGILFITDNVPSTSVNISNNTISGYNFGILSLSLASTSINANIIISGNSISACSRAGIFIDATSYASGIVNISENVIKNTISTTSSGGISVNGGNSPNSAFVFIDNNNITTTSSSPNTFGISLSNSVMNSIFNADISNNTILTGAGVGSIGIIVETGTPSAVICATISDNTVTEQVASGTNDFLISGNVNIDNFSGNIGSNIFTTGDVNLVPEGTCGE